MRSIVLAAVAALFLLLSGASGPASALDLGGYVQLPNKPSSGTLVMPDSAPEPAAFSSCADSGFLSSAVCRAGTTARFMVALGKYLFFLGLISVAVIWPLLALLANNQTITVMGKSYQLREFVWPFFLSCCGGAFLISGSGMLFAFLTTGAG
ncbi:protein of unknown function (plasmid) [Magnetospirillum sp. XM-1]|uniref:hypothetical protein n=1 Tax=Magnetospirillum sp. XM-1 TaxID=1663591 RepID=UPI00073DC7D1|nr:hypothetical protein [Magnetospirillum sp. XM-1]CUW41945.1 protein of unknown function [Magnetospirillum sp. XM-1]